MSISSVTVWPISRWLSLECPGVENFSTLADDVDSAFTAPFDAAPRDVEYFCFGAFGRIVAADPVDCSADSESIFSHCRITVEISRYDSGCVFTLADTGDNILGLCAFAHFVAVEIDVISDNVAIVDIITLSVRKAS